MEDVPMSTMKELKRVVQSKRMDEYINRHFGQESSTVAVNDILMDVDHEDPQSNFESPSLSPSNTTHGPGTTRASATIDTPVGDGDLFQESEVLTMNKKRKIVTTKKLSILAKVASTAAETENLHFPEQV